MPRRIIPPAPAQAPTDPPSAVDVTPPGSSPATGAARAPASRAQAEPRPTERPGLGTEFGEARESRIVETRFSRANPTTPSAVVAIRYNDRAGLLALGIAVPPPYAARDRDLGLRETAEPFRETRFAQAPP
jgi:uncharacterized protein (DUF58 family)